jgi:hypothetical protein
MLNLNLIILSLKHSFVVYVYEWDEVYILKKSAGSKGQY